MVLTVVDGTRRSRDTMRWRRPTSTAGRPERRLHIDGRTLDVPRFHRGAVSTAFATSAVLALNARSMIGRRARCPPDRLGYGLERQATVARGAKGALAMDPDNYTKPANFHIYHRARRNAYPCSQVHSAHIFREGSSGRSGNREDRLGRLRDRPISRQGASRTRAREGGGSLGSATRSCVRPATSRWRHGCPSFSGAVSRTNDC
jgi:hypothetical protein